MKNDQRKNLRSDIWRESVSEEVSEELSFHVEMRARELAAKRGIDIEEARRTAMARFGDIRYVQAQCEEIGGRRDRDMKRNTFWSEVVQDARYALRQIRSAPGFSLLVIGTLALGIGATTTIFSALNAVVLRPFSFSNADRIIWLTETWNGQEGGNVSISNFEAWRDQATQFEEMAAINWTNYNLSIDDQPEQVLGAAITHNWFRVFGVQPALGRAFTPEDDRPGAPSVVLLAHNTWQRRFSGNPAIVGTDITVNGQPSRVIGVMPEGFDPTLSGEELWIPAAFTPERRANNDEHYLVVTGLLKRGATVAGVQQELDRIAAVQAAKYPQENAGRTIAFQPIRDILIAGYDKRLMLLLGAVAVVLLIACANVANLLLARGAARQKELAVRGAMGAGRQRILRQLLTENLVLALATVVVSLGIAAAGVKLIVAFAPSGIPRIAETRIDPIVLLFALAVGVISSLIFGLAPALRAMRLDLQSTLRSGGRDAQGTIRDWLRSALVMAEVALSVLLLIGAGLLIRTSIKVSQVDTGFRTDGVVAARITLPEQAYADPAQVVTTFQRIVDQLARQPGVTTAAASSQAPMGPGGNSNGVIPEGKPFIAENAVDARLRMVSADYLDAMGIELELGRQFDTRDTRSGSLVAIVSRGFAQKLWPGENPIGRRFACCEGKPNDPMLKTVIGVAADVHSQSPTSAPGPDFYLPMAQVPPAAWSWIDRSMTIVAAGNAGTEPLVGAIRNAVRSVDPKVPIYSVTTMRDALRNVTAPARFNTMLLSILGFLGLILAAIGIYGVVSYFVNLRTKEIGVRIALGATSGSVLRLMSRQALAPVAAGLLIGVAASLAATRLLAASLFDVDPTDPLTFATVVAGLLAVATLAILVPARRAARVPPTQALQG
jgi:putative ABC transport system permease protein